MALREIGPIDLDVSSVTDGFLSPEGQFSIQPIPNHGICGNPTWSLEVSNSKDENSFKLYSDDVSGLTMDDCVQSDDVRFPWKYFRISIISNVGDSGSVIFNVYH